MEQRGERKPEGAVRSGAGDGTTAMGSISPGLALLEDEIEALTRGQPVPRRSALHNLTPFLDDEGVLRVGGRIKHSLLSYDERHPIILPADSHFTGLLISAAHQRTLHGGVQLTLGSLRQRFWIPRVRALVRSHIHRCVPCVRWRATHNLP